MADEKENIIPAADKIMAELIADGEQSRHLKQKQETMQIYSQFIDVYRNYPREPQRQNKFNATLFNRMQKQMIDGKP